MDIVKKIAVILTIIGGLNWGLVGLCDFDLVAFCFGPMSAMSRIVYCLVGVGAIISMFSDCVIKTVCSKQ